jgi:hypothetical protein
MTKVRIITIFGDGWSEPQFELVDPSVSLEAFARLHWNELGERVVVELLGAGHAAVELFTTDPGDPGVEHSQVFDLHSRLGYVVSAAPLPDAALHASL